MKNTSMPFLFLDLETTGHNPLRRLGKTLIIWHEIIEFGALLVAPKTLDVIGEFEVKIHPLYPEHGDEIAWKVNDYPERAKNGEWRNAHSLWEGVNLLFKFLKDKPVVLIGQNFSFDWTFLQVALASLDISDNKWGEYFHYGRLDTRSMSVQALMNPEEGYDPNDYSIRNKGLSEILCLPQEPYPHKALNGAKQSYHIFKKLLELKQK